MQAFLRSYFIAVLFAVFAGCDSDSEKTLPILGHRRLDTLETGGKLMYDTVYHTIPPFRFVDQDSAWVTEDTFRDKIYVADFFFTSCPTICPVMKTQMLRVYQAFKDNNEVLLLSHTIDPEYDTVATLREFARRLGVESGKWHFVTGRKDDIYSIGEKSYMVTAQEDPSEPGGYLHSGAFILVDKEKRIRGYYDGTDKKEVDRLIKDIPALLNEYRRKSSS